MPVAAARAARETSAAYGSSTRWLRGRIVDRLRNAPGDAWVRIDDTIGDRGPAAVAAALEGLHRDGLIERHPDDRSLVRLPTAASGTRGPQ